MAECYVHSLFVYTNIKFGTLAWLGQSIYCQMRKIIRLIIENGYYYLRKTFSHLS